MAAITRGSRRREALIIALLVVVGIVLAFCMFAAGVLWRSRPAKQSLFSPRALSAASSAFEIGEGNSESSGGMK